MAINRKYLEDAKMRVLASLGNIAPEQPKPTGFPMQMAGGYGRGQLIQTPEEQQALEFAMRGMPPQGQQEQPQQAQPSQVQYVDQTRAQARIDLQKQMDAERIQQQKMEEERRKKGKKVTPYFGYQSPADL